MKDNEQKVGTAILSYTVYSYGFHPSTPKIISATSF